LWCGARCCWCAVGRGRRGAAPLPTRTARPSPGRTARTLTRRLRRRRLLPARRREAARQRVFPFPVKRRRLPRPGQSRLLQAAQRSPAGTAHRRGRSCFRFRGAMRRRRAARPSRRRGCRMRAVRARRAMRTPAAPAAVRVRRAAAAWGRWRAMTMRRQLRRRRVGHGGDCPRWRRSRPTSASKRT